MSKLLIVESPNKAKSITKYLGADWVVKATVGHICDLPSRELGVDPVTYELVYVVDDAKKGVVAGLKAAAKAAEEVFIATDPDREGEAIAWHVKRLLGLRDPKRVTFQEITPKECRAAVLAPTRINMALVHAQEARRCEDRIVGFPVSTALQRKSGRRGLSAGRVQTPGLGIVVRRELEIRAFVSIAHFGVKLHFVESTGKPWTAEWLTKPFLAEGAEYIMDRGLADRVAALRSVRVAKSESKAQSKAPPPPFTTSTLQQAASAKCKINPKRCMQIAQSLFEKGLITYHRTDLPNLREDTIELVREYAKQRGWALPASGRTWAVKDSAQGAHEAIRPTDLALEDATRHADASRAATAEEQKLYDLIRLRAIGSQLADAVYDVQTLVLEARERVDGRAVHFAARGRTLRSAGFLTLAGEDATEESREDPTAANPVPPLGVGELREAVKGARQDKKTEPPSRYSKAQLIKALEKHEIGRPSTFANIVETIEERQYVVEDGGKLRPTPIGEAVFTSLEPMFGFAQLEFTRDMESALDEIAMGRATYRDVVSAAAARLKGELEAFSRQPLQQALHVESAGSCPVCQAGQVVRRSAATAPAKRGKKGSAAAAKTATWWSCNAYPTCRASFTDVDGRPDLANPRVPQPAIDPNDPNAIRCPTCSKGALVRREGQFGPWWGCSGYRDGCKATFKELDGKPDLTPPPKLEGPPCPECRSGTLVLREGRRGPWWGCSKYPKCKAKRDDSGGQPAQWSGIQRGRSRSVPLS